MPHRALRLALLVPYNVVYFYLLSSSKKKGIVHNAGTYLCFAEPRTQARKAVGIAILSVTQDKPTTDA